MPAGSCRLGAAPAGFGLEKFFRVGLEAFAAPRAAKQVFLALIFKPMLGGLGLDLHAADWIDRNLGILIGCAMRTAAAGVRSAARIVAA